MGFGNGNTLSKEELEKRNEIMEQRKAALFGGSKDQQEYKNMEMRESTVIYDVDLKLIDDNPDNKKIFNMNAVTGLANYIKNKGFADPINVIQKSDGRYEIISGHRRRAAVALLGYETIPCHVIMVTDDIDKAEKLIGFNIHNRNITPLDMARSIEYYINNVLMKRKEQGETISIPKACCDFFEMSETHLKRYRAVLKMIPQLQELALDPMFPFTAFYSAAKFDEKQQLKLYNDIMECQKKYPEIEISRNFLESVIKSIKEQEIRRRELAAKKIEVEKAEAESLEEQYGELILKELEKETKKDEKKLSLDNTATVKEDVIKKLDLKNEKINNIKSVIGVMPGENDNSLNIESNVKYEVKSVLPMEKDNIISAPIIFMENIIDPIAKQLESIRNKEYTIKDAKKVKKSIDQIKKSIEGIEKLITNDGV